MTNQNETEIRVIELAEVYEDEGSKRQRTNYEHHIQYRNDNGLWISLPVVRTSDREKYNRMKAGADA